MSSDTRVIDSLQALRGAAALAVFLFHLIPYFAVSGTHLFPAWLWRSGEFGVDLFFVLSGAVLALGYASRELRFKGAQRPGRSPFVNFSGTTHLSGRLAIFTHNVFGQYLVWVRASTG